MLKEFVEKLLSLATPEYHEQDGREYSSRPLHDVRAPEVTPIEVQTLAGFRDLYKLHDQGEQPGIILIEDHETVWLMAKEPDEWKRRASWVKAALPGDTAKFRFGSWLEPEEFVIGLQTLFSDSEQVAGDLRKVLKLVSNLAAEAVTISSDDGYSQQVQTRQGILSKGEEKVSPRVTLAPYRTFREVAQPSSEFVLRLRGRQGQMPACALFEADGGEWKHEAVKNIRDYFQKELPDAETVA